MLGITLGDGQELVIPVLIGQALDGISRRRTSLKKHLGRDGMRMDEVKCLANGVGGQRERHHGLAHIIHREHVQLEFAHRGAAEPDIALHQAIEKIVGIEHTGLTMARNGTRAIDDHRQAAFARLGHQLFRHPFAGVVATARGGIIFEAIGFVKGRGAGGWGEGQDAKRGGIVDGFGPALAGKRQNGPGPLDVGRLQFSVGQ